MAGLVEVLARAIDPDAFWNAAAPDKLNMERSFYNGLCNIARNRARACLAALDAAGHRVVPVKPTEYMLQAAVDALEPSDLGRIDLEFAWGAALAAAPKVDSPAAEGGSRDG